LKAREWLGRGDLATDPFDALSNYWRGFNNLFAGKGQERELISTFLRSQIDEPFAQKLIDEQAKGAKILMQQPVVDMRGNGRDTSLYIDQYDTAETAIEKLEALFMVIYQIRCNFEHGQKSPSRDRDRDLCRTACPFIAALVSRSLGSDEK
jgi:hypothetical protein